jgi:dipeptidyl aminopeptidase/acylaminoacyl peptidase
MTHSTGRCCVRVVQGFWICLLLAIALNPAQGQSQGQAQVPAAKRAFETRDWYRVKTVASPAMSPDGKYIAVQITSVLEAANKRVNEIWVVPTAPGGGDPVRFTAPGVDSTNPRFSGDGTLLIFNSTRPGYPGTQWAIRMDRPGGEFPYTAASSGPGGEAADSGEFSGRQGGAFPGGGGFAGGGGAASSPKDGSFTVTTGTEGAQTQTAGAGQGRGGGRGTGQPGIPGGARGAAPADPNDPYAKMPPMAKPPATAITLPLDPARFDGMQINDARYKANGRGYIPSTGAAAGGTRGGGARGAEGGGRGSAGGDNNQPPAQILVDKKDGAGRKAITNTSYSHRNAVVSPDGKWIAFLADADLRADSEVRVVRDSIAKLDTEAARTAATRDRLQSDIFVIPAVGGEPKRIHTQGSENGLEWSPDSRYIAFTANNGQYTNTDIFLGDVTTVNSRSLTSGLHTDPGPVSWLPTNELLMQLTLGGRNALYRVNPRTGDRKEIVGGARRISGFTYDSARTKVAYVATTADMPAELFISDLNGTQERQLTHFNAEVNAAVAWSTHERFTYKSVGNVEIEGWLLRPYGYEPGKKYPLVLYIHGGPHSAYNEGWFDEFQNLAGAGMWVLYTNPRGSSGYGGEFTYMTRGKWGAEDYEDLMKAVDIAAARPDVDAARLGVTGGSYGGFMTAWITTKTDRFKAAETDRMIANWVSWYGSSDAQSLTEGEFFGTPWQSWDLYINMSPIKYANKVKTPTLMIQSEEDYRAPIEDAEQWFMALKKYNVPVEFIRYPRSNHDLSRTGEPWLLTDRLYRIRQWFCYWLKDEKPQRVK